MIDFVCPQCGTSYTVATDRAGQQTRCEECGELLLVPKPPQLKPTPTPTRRSPAQVAAPVLGGLALIASVVCLMSPPPARATVERRLRAELPPGYEQLTIDEYNTGTGRLEVRVRDDDNSLLPTEYSAIRYRDDNEWRVKVTGRRRPLDRPAERWLMVEAVFDRRGRITQKKGVTLAPPGEEQLFEGRARAIALAVHAAL